MAMEYNNGLQLLIYPVLLITLPMFLFGEQAAGNPLSGEQDWPSKEEFTIPDCMNTTLPDEIFQEIIITNLLYNPPAYLLDVDFLTPNMSICFPLSSKFQACPKTHLRDFEFQMGANQTLVEISSGHKHQLGEYYITPKRLGLICTNVRTWPLILKLLMSNIQEAFE